MNTTRRNFLLGTAALSGTLLASGAVRATTSTLADATLPNAVQPDVCVAAPKLKGKIHGLGIEGHLFPGAKTYKKRTSTVLTTVDLESGAVKQTPLAMGEGHAAMSLGDGRILCTGHHQSTSMLVDPEHKVIKTFIAPEGYRYGGHSLILPDKGIIVMPMRHQKAMTEADEGRFQVYDIKTTEQIDVITSGGLHPHEIHRIPGTDEMAVTHYGEINVEKRPLTFNTPFPKLTILDANTLKAKRHYPVGEYNAMLTHMNVADDKWAYCVLTQYIQLRPTKELKKGDNVLEIADRDLEGFLGRKRDYPIHPLTATLGELAIPLPYLRINTQTGEKEALFDHPGQQLRAQSVAANRATGLTVATYFHSNRIALHKAGQKLELINGGELGLSDVRGVAEIQGTPYVAFSGHNFGMAIFDLQARKVIARYPTGNFHMVHVYHDSVLA